MKIFFFLIAICILFSCSDKNKTPAGIISPKEMSGIMWDLVRAQSFAIAVARKDSSVNVESQTKVLTRKVFEIHKISSSSFDKSYEWYVSHPDIFRNMFDSLYIQKQRENDLKMNEKYNHFRKNPLPPKIIKR